MDRQSQSEFKNWAVPLRRAPRVAGAIDPCTASASELMFFWDAPLAHVVDYEEHVVARRRQLEVKQISRRRGVDRVLLDPPASLFAQSCPDAAP
jgi:hypothetical protein